MKKEKLWIPLIFLLIIFGGWSCRGKEEVLEVTRGQGKEAEEEVESKFLASEPFVYDSRGERDPFVPVAEGAEEGPTLTWLSLEGILWKPENPMAIINDQIVSKGDIVQGAEVIDIKEDGVVLRYGEEQSVLRLKNK